KAIVRIIWTTARSGTSRKTTTRKPTRPVIRRAATISLIFIHSTTRGIVGGRGDHGCRQSGWNSSAGAEFGRYTFRYDWMRRFLLSWAVVLSCTVGSAAYGQPAPPSAFQVASVKPAPRSDGRIRPSMRGGPGTPDSDR